MICSFPKDVRFCARDREGATDESLVVRSGRLGAVPWMLLITATPLSTGSVGINYWRSEYFVEISPFFCGVTNPTIHGQISCS